MHRIVTILLGAVLAGYALPVPAEDLPESTVSHRRMLAELERIAAESRVNNPYLGEGPVGELRKQLAALPGEGPDPRRWYFNMLLGANQLRLGNNEEAIGHHLAAVEQLERLGEDVPPHERLRTWFELGVAYMRLGETRNCAARHTSESCILPIQGGGVHQVKGPSRQAVAAFTRVLEKARNGSRPYLAARWLLNIAHMTLGSYPQGVPELWRMDPTVFASESAFPRFTEVAPELGLNAFDLAGGAIADDFNGDGLLDLVVSTMDTDGPMHFFKNRGDGKFADETEQAGLKGLLGGLNMIHADYDNDGDLDVMVLRGGWFGDQGRHPNSLLRNDGKGRFEDVTFLVGLGERHYPTQTAAWADYDNDGDLDLYVGNEGGRREAPSQLFRNQGDGTFVDVAAAAGVRNDRYAKSVAWGDYDGDRDPDLYVSNYHDVNRLYRNNADGTFTDVAVELGVEGPRPSFPAWFWDYDNDGALDLYVTAYGNKRRPPEVSAVAGSYLGMPDDAELASLYRGDGKGGFRDVAAASGLTRVTLPMGSNFGDLDNDGFLDFYLGTGYPNYEGLMPNVMYHNQGGKRFVDVTTAGGFGHLQKGHGVVFADLDNDGDQDVFEQIGGAFPGDAFGNVLFRNPGFDNNWIKIRLVGVDSNRWGIGARIRLEIVEGEERRSIYHHVNTGGSFGSNPLRREIGLGRAERIDLLEVYWPTSDTTQRFRGVAANRSIEITERRKRYKVVSPKPTR